MIAVDPFAGGESVASALLYVASERYACRILDLGHAGVLLAPPTRRVPGVYVRLNLSLPTFDRMVDLDGLITDTGGELAVPLWSIAFVDPPDEATAVIDSYLERRHYGALPAAMGPPGTDASGRTLVGYAVPASPPRPQGVLMRPPPLPPDDEWPASDITGPQPHVATYPGTGPALSAQGAAHRIVRASGPIRRSAAGAARARARGCRR